MLRELFSDARVRRAYIATKVGVFAVAALLTWPLAGVIGPKAWIGLGVFGVLLLALSAAVLGSAALTADRGGTADLAADESEGDEPEDADPLMADPVELAIEDSIDLHSFPPADVPAVVEDYLRAASERGFAEVRLIHGRGVGVQRERVRGLLGRHPDVISFADAPPERGGWGATVAILRRRSPSPDGRSSG